MDSLEVLLNDATICSNKGHLQFLQPWKENVLILAKKVSHSRQVPHEFEDNVKAFEDTVALVNANRAQRDQSSSALNHDEKKAEDPRHKLQVVKGKILESCKRKWSGQSTQGPS